MDGRPRREFPAQLIHSWSVKKKGENRKRKLERSHRHGAFGKAKNLPPSKINGAEKTHHLVFPERLNFISDYHGAITFFAELRHLLFDRKVRIINLDHTNQTEISPESALLLIAELYRSHERDKTKVKRCVCPADPSVCWVLHGVGYFKYFPGVHYPIAAQQRGYMRHDHDSRVRGASAKVLIQHFEKRVTFAPQGRETLYNALVESMNNVAEHAYPERRRNKLAYSEWWLLGYFDDAAREISFSFYDQGLGIPRTIRARLRHELRSGASLIREAVERGISRTKVSTRGKGLPSLKKFVDASVDGTLVISSHTSQCVFSKGKPPLEQTWNIPLSGTLITWNIQLPEKKERP